MATLYHAPNARSLRVLWTLEELGAKADVKTLPFPPREKQPDYLRVPCRQARLVASGGAGRA